MSYAYLIDTMNYDDTFSVNVEAFVPQIQQRWENVEIRHTSSPMHLLSWFIRYKGKVGLCSLHHDEQTLAVEGDLEIASEVAVWYKNIVPVAVKLFFYNGTTFHKPIEIVPGITVQQLIDDFSQLMLDGI